MADITKCEGTNCPRKEQCYRFTAVSNPWRQSFFAEVPLKEDGACDYFWQNDGQQGTRTKS